MRLQPPTVPLALYRDAYVELDDKRLVRRAVNDATFKFLEDRSDSVVFSATVDAELVDGEPTCTRLVFLPGTGQLTRALLRQFDPRWYAAFLLTVTGMVLTDDNSGTPDSEGIAELLVSQPRRRTVNDERLAAVADAYRTGGAPAVERDCRVSRSQAYRLVSQARAAGMLS
jgi:hypothetical protein